MASLSADSVTVAHNMGMVRSRVASACERVGRNPDDVTICAATKYVEADGMAALREAGVRAVAENRLQDMADKQERFRDDFEWHFIGRIQSRKVPAIAERVVAIHSLATDSARERLNSVARPPRVLVQVNVSGEPSKEGVAPALLEAFLAGCRFSVHGLMTMPPPTANPDAARPYFRELATLARRYELPDLSIGTTQDFEVAVEEGATLIRVGSALFEPIPS